MKENIIIALLLILVGLFAYIALRSDHLVSAAVATSMEEYLDLKGYSVTE